MNISFNGKRILITGAGQGIGRALALRLSQYEATVLALSRTKKHLDTLKNEDPRIITAVADLRDWYASRQTVQSVLPIDMLVNNVGGSQPSPYLDSTKDFYELTTDINLKAAFNVSQVVAKNMIETKVAGCIVNMSSVAGQMAFKDYSVYSIAKSGLDMLTKSMALELGPYNIRVNSVNPTVVMKNTGKCTYKESIRYQEFIEKNSLRRIPRLDDVVDAVVFLLSDRSKMITGALLPIDAGLL